MLSETKTALKQLLFQQDGYYITPYQDNNGNTMIGIQRNLTDRGISLSEAYALLDNDIDYFDDKLRDLLDFYSGLSASRQAVLVNMCFSLGVMGLLKLKDMLRCLKEGNYEAAARNILLPECKQLGIKAIKLSGFMSEDSFRAIEA